MKAADEVASIKLQDVSTAVHEETLPDRQPDRTLWQSVIAFRSLIPFLLGIYVLVIAVGIDSGIAGLTLGIESFRRQFGYYLNDESGWVIEAKYQSAWSGASTGSQTIGAMISGYMADRIGRIWPLRIASIIILVGAILLVTARQIAVLIAGKVILGLGIGFVVSQTAPFLSELAPAKIRGMCVASINVCLVLGQWLSTIVIWACTSAYSDVNDNTPWLVVFGIQLVFPTIFLIWSLWIPESPVHLVQSGKVELARASARKLYGPAYDSDAHVNGIVREAEEESSGEGKSISFWEAGKGVNLRRTLIGTMVVVGQILSGNLFVLSYQNYFYELAGISGSQALTFGNYSVALVANLCSYLVIDTIGRRPLYTTGSFMLGVANFLVGFMSLVQNSNRKAAGSVAVFGMYLWSFTYQFTVGPAAWAIVGEVPSNRMRAKTNSWVNMINSLASFAINYAIPYLFNPDAANLGLKMGYIFGALSGVLCFLSFLYLPETKGYTVQELDYLFNLNIPARKFTKTIS
ncbi:unnamed protein product [Clonostachys rosea]|uniref:Major facilitator superfamily (MFS) profile domain-containing protein n=1 Tax=Bionectria ochroleuca TaxID=29856 RepID=A0ABY6TYH0_BIOOC|nr:unnamed protein product [Clonostachys rosea]